jgi:hypothetical protein
VPRYRIVKSLPDALVYGDGTWILLEQFVSVYSIEILHAKKDLPPGRFSAVVICRGDHVPLPEKLAKGFDVDTSTPAGVAANRVMLGLVAKGYAKLVVD